MKQTAVRIGLLMLLATLVSATDVTGKWKGSFDAGGGNRDLTIDLKSDGNAVTGTVSGLEKPVEIKDGKLQGSEVTFWFTTEYQGNSYKLVYKGQLTGEEMKVTLGLEDGSWSTN